VAVFTKLGRDNEDQEKQKAGTNKMEKTPDISSKNKLIKNYYFA